MFIADGEVVAVCWFYCLWLLLRFVFVGGVVVGVGCNYCCCLCAFLLLLYVFAVVVFVVCANCCWCCS